MKRRRPGMSGVLAALAACLGMGAAAARAQPATAPAAPQGTVHTLAATGRTYELLAPPDAPKAPAPVAIYLHPTGQPMLDRARRDYWPVLARRKCLMVIPRGASPKMWLAGEDKFVMDCLADVQVRHAVDAGRVCLLGVSGGGQLALFLADHMPEKFRAVVAVSTNPVVVRGSRSEWFYPDRKTLDKCPYLVVNHITQGSALMYWRQVAAKLAGTRASISILPVTGPAGEYLPPPAGLGAWLDEVLAGKHPAAMPDPQAAAVAKTFAMCMAVLPKAITTGKPAPTTAPAVAKRGDRFQLAATPPKDFDRSAREDKADTPTDSLVQIRFEHNSWPITLRCEGRITRRPMTQVLADEEAETVARGLLYQVYWTGDLEDGRRTWKVKIGSITYPDRERGWVSTLFIQAAAPEAASPQKWMRVVVQDETQQPQAGELAAVLRAAIAALAIRPLPPATAPARP